MAVKYAEVEEAIRAVRTPSYGRTSSGYTKRSGAPTSVLVRLKGEKKFRRAMVWQFSNAGTTFVNIKGQPHVVGIDFMPVKERFGPVEKDEHARIMRQYLNSKAKGSR